MKTNNQFNIALTFAFLLINSAWADSSKIALPNVTPMTPITTPTTTSMSQEQIQGIVSNRSLECGANENRDFCWMRYRATMGSTSPINNIECPANYFSIIRYGKDALNPANNRPIAFYEQSHYDKVTSTQYSALLAENYTCVPNQNLGTQEDQGSGTSCHFQSEGARPDSMTGRTITMADGYIGINSPSETRAYGPQDWTIAGAARCDRYTLAGCPGAWCSKTTKYGYIYRWIRCSRPAGYYPPIDPTTARVLKIEIPPVSTHFTPAIVICSKGIASHQQVR